MEPIPQEVEDYIKETIEDALGLSVSTHTLQQKLRATEHDCYLLKDHNLYLQLKLNEKDDVISRARAEASMNAQAVKKFVEENQILAVECANLLSQSTRWEKECSLYDQDREALMDFANEADERAKDAEIRVHELEEELKRKTKESQFYKDQCEMQPSESSAERSSEEQILLDSLMTALVGNDEVAKSAHAFLEANCGVEACQRLLKMWDSLRPSTRNILALTAELKNVEKDKEHLRINLARAEEEVNLLYEENKVLDKENKRLMKKERRCSGSSEKHTSSASTKLSMYNKTRNRGLAFITMGSNEEATAALSNLESFKFEGRSLNLAWAKPRKKKQPMPPKSAAVHNLYVANLPFQARAKDLKEFFNSENGNVVSAEIIFNEKPRRSAGYGFVSFYTKEEAEAALLNFQDKEFMERKIRIARSKRFLRQGTKESLQGEMESTNSSSNSEQFEAAN